MAVPVGLCLAVLAFAGCAGEQVAVDVPAPSRGDIEICTLLHARLPAEVDGRKSVETEPASELTAAWGDPPVVLRCGVAKPHGLRATSEILEVNGVEWFLRESGRGFAFTSVGRAVNVELFVPSSVDRTQATAPLVDVADAVGQVPPAQAPSGHG